MSAVSVSSAILLARYKFYFHYRDLGDRRTDAANTTKYRGKSTIPNETYFNLFYIKHKNGYTIIYLRFIGMQKYSQPTFRTLSTTHNPTKLAINFSNPTRNNSQLDKIMNKIMIPWFRSRCHMHIVHYFVLIAEGKDRICLSPAWKRTTSRS